MSSTNSPESSSDLWLERSNFAGAILGGVSYGVHLCVFVTTIYYMTRPKNKGSGLSPGRLPWPFMVYMWVMFALGTFQLAGNTNFLQKVWIDDRGIDGGPIAYLETHFDDPVVTFANAAFSLANFLADGMLLYRLVMVWNNYYIAIVPFLAFLASSTLSALTVFQFAQPGASLWTQNANLNVVVPFYSLTIALNTLMTLAIAVRLLYIRRTIQSVLGPEHARMYTSISAMFVESGAIYSITGLVFIIAYARESNVQNLAINILDQVVCIAPELIILRVALGRAWTRETSARTLDQTRGGSVRFRTMGKSTGATGASAITGSTAGGSGFGFGMSVSRVGATTSVPVSDLSGTLAGDTRSGMSDTVSNTSKGYVVGGSSDDLELGAVTKKPMQWD